MVHCEYYADSIICMSKGMNQKKEVKKPKKDKKDKKAI